MLRTACILKRYICKDETCQEIKFNTMFGQMQRQSNLSALTYLLDNTIFHFKLTSWADTQALGIGTSICSVFSKTVHQAKSNIQLSFKEANEQVFSNTVCVNFWWSNHVTDLHFLKEYGYLGRHWHGFYKQVHLHTSGVLYLHFSINLDSVSRDCLPYKPEQQKMTKQYACRQTLDLNFMILYFGEMQSLNSLKTLIIVTGVSVSLPADRSNSSKTEVRFYKLAKNASRHDQWVEFCFALMNQVSLI